MPGSRSQQDPKPTATIEVGQDLSRASLGELQQELQVRIKDLQSRREALVRELQEVDEQLLAHTGGPGGKKLIEPCNQGIGGSSNASKMSNAWRKHWLRCCPMRSSR